MKFIGVYLAAFLLIISRQALAVQNNESYKSTTDIKTDTTQEKNKPADITEDVNKLTFLSDKNIGRSDTIRGNVIVKGADLTVHGTIIGDVLVVGGNLHLESTGLITGNTRVVDGNLIKANGGVIGGEDRSDTLKSSYRETSAGFSRSEPTFDVPWQAEPVNLYRIEQLDKFVFRYNRVESIFLGIAKGKKYYWNGKQPWNAYGSIGWGFKSHTWRGNIGLVRQFIIPVEKGNSIVEIGVEGYTLTDTKDQWLISSLENTASAFLIHEDFRNYFERRGFTLHSAFYLKQKKIKCELKIAYIADSYESLSNKVDWALFGGNKKFRDNPPVNQGNMRSVEIMGGLSTVLTKSIGPEGWSLFTSAEFAKRNWNSEFDFDQYILDVRRFHPLGRYENVNIRLRMGSSYGTLPMQKVFELGGLGTMNAFPFKSEIGNRMMLVNMEFVLSGNVFKELDFWPLAVLQEVNFMFISDAGFTRNVPSAYTFIKGFNDIKWNEFKHNFGFALAHRSGNFRIGFAWRTDHPAPLQFILRFSRPF